MRLFKYMRFIYHISLPLSRKIFSFLKKRIDAPPRPFSGWVSYRRWNCGKRNKKSTARERRSRNQTDLREGILNDLDQLQEVF